MTRQAKTTTDHEEIRRWVEARGGRPVTVEGSGEPGVLRIDFPGYRSPQPLRDISWEAFFRKFDQEALAFVYQEEKSPGQRSRFWKLVRR